MEKNMKLEFERDTSIEDKNRFHRYYQVIKYDLATKRKQLHRCSNLDTKNFA